MPRLFSAIRLPASLSLQLSLLKGGLSGARWIDPENYHITLRFFGDVDRHTANDLALELGSIRREAFDLRIQRLDVFGNSKPHALYASIAPCPELAELNGEIERIAKRCGLRPDPRKFTPHITLARLKGGSASALAGYLAARGGFSTLPFPVTAFELMSSRASIGGGPYITEERFELLSRHEGEDGDDYGEEEEDFMRGKPGAIAGRAR